jgi:hypothetical protein
VEWCEVGRLTPLSIGINRNMRSIRCRECGNETLQKDICVLCQTGITQMYEDLKDLLKKDREQSVLNKKHKRSLPRLNYQLSRRNGKRPTKRRGSTNQ